MKRTLVKAWHYYFLNRRKCTDLQTFNRHSIFDPKEKTHTHTYTHTHTHTNPDCDPSLSRAESYNKGALQDLQFFTTKEERDSYY